MRIKCWMFGCADGYLGEFGSCDRCGADSDSPQWRKGGGFLLPVWWLVQGTYKWLKRRTIGRKCDVCGKRFRSTSYSWTCSPKCETLAPLDIPF